MDARTPGAPIDRNAQRGQTDIGAEDARQAMKTGYMRRVLSVSLVLVVIAMVGVWLWLYRAPPASTAPAATAATEAPVLQRDMTPAPGAPTRAAPQSSQPLP